MSLRVPPPVSRPTPAHAGFVLFLALALLLPARPAPAFQVWRHSNMTDEVLTRQGVSGYALDIIKQGVRWPDLAQCFGGCYCPTALQIILICSDPTPTQVLQFSEYHYDNNRILESMANVERLMGEARLGLRPPGPPNSEAERRAVGVALMAFGKALHVIQDFYAHSTWVELNHDFVSIGGRIDSAPMWNGEDNWGTGTANVAGVVVAGVQTGYERLAPPPGSVTHSQLNKDHANTPQGQKTVNRIFPFGLIGTYYEIASGQNGASAGSYKDTGLAPRHTIRAWQCLFLDCAIYQLPPGPSATPASVAPARSAATMDIASTIAWVNSDPGMGAVAAFMDSIWAAADADSPSTYQYQLFDADGWPLPPNVSVTDLSRPVARVLDRAWPNPFAGRVSVRFYAPHAGHARLEVFDVSGRRLHTLVDQQLEPGWKDVIWDGKDASGRALPSGTYLCRLQAFGRNESCLLSLTR